ncbi:MAG TPA: peptide ABC transporter substrate-binding protein [Tepidisphaeraceae bacterium]|nr:peptide ABC transporter substrate-binding protein [Tepidisphaeraceae bacterium]
MLRLLIIPLALLGLVAGAVVWSNKGQGPAADFIFNARGDNKTLDLGVMSWQQDMRIAYCLWEGLYTCDPVTLKPIPGSAFAPEVNKEQTVYTFHIRPEARWSNGDDLTAGDFLFAWRRLLEQPGEYTYLVHYLKGAGDYELAFQNWKQQIAAGKNVPPPDFKTVGVEALDARTLRVTLAQPVVFFYSLCAFPTFFPQHEPSMRPFAQWDSEKKNYVASYDQAFTRPPHLVTNGPYRLADWSFKRRLRMIANDHYWDRRNVRSAIIDQIYIDDQMAAFRAYDSGEVDWLADMDNDMAADLLLKNRPELKVFPNFGTYFYDFNCEPKLKDGTKNPFADRRVRRAFCMAIDKEPIVRNVTRTGEPITTTLVPHGSFADYPSPPGLPYDLPEARRLMAEAGYPGGANFPRLRLMFNSDFSQHGQIAQVLRRQWQENLGVDLELEAVEVKVFGERLHNHEFNIGRASWYGDYYDPTTFTDVFKSASDNNDPDWRVPAYDDLLHKAELEIDPHKRFKILAEAENMLLEDAPILPLYQYVGHYLFRDNVHGIPLDSRLMVMMQAIWVDRSSAAARR